MEDHIDDPLRGYRGFDALLNDAVDRYNRSTGKDLNSLPFLAQIRDSSSATEISMLLGERLHDFEMFRKHGKKMRDILNPVVRMLIQLGDASADAASAVVPCSKFVITAISGLLEAFGDVSDFYDTIEHALRKIRDTLARFETYLQPSIPISTRLSEILTETLVVILDILGLIMKYCDLAKQAALKNKHVWWLICKRRGKDYMKTILGRVELQGKLEQLENLTKDQALQTAAEVHAEIRKMRVEKEDHQTREWLQPVDVDTPHVELLHKRQGKTCAWIFDDLSFREWRARPNGVFAVLGHPGSGKSILCALIVDRLRDEIAASPTSALAYFYFYSNSSHADHYNNNRNLMSSLLFQVARSSPRRWAYLQQERNKPLGLSHPTNDQLFEILRRLLAFGPPTIIVIDALDECHSLDARSSGEQDDMLKFLSDLSELGLPDLKLLVTSRPEVKILDNLLSDASCLVLKLHEHPKHFDDMDEVIVDRLLKPGFRRFGEATLKKARVALTNKEKSQGMFLWVALQLRDLERCSPNEITRAIESLPRGLDQTYRGILTRFNASDSSRARARFILALIAFARRPLTIHEVANAFAYDLDHARVSPFEDDIPDAEAFVLSQLPSLVDVVASSEKERVVQFIHFSMKEYLTGVLLRDDSEPMFRYFFDPYFANTSIAALSIAALGAGQVMHHFRGYAAEYWHEHVLPDMEDSERDLDSVIRDPTAWRKATTHLDATLASFLSAKSKPFADWSKGRGTPLHWAARLGLPSHTARLLEEYGVDDMDGDGDTPLAYVASNTSSQIHLDIIDLLLSYGANIRLQPPPTQWSVLHRAIMAPRPDLAIAHLIAKGAKVDAAKKDGTTALHEAAWLGYDVAVSTLLEYGASKDAFAGSQTPLHRAAWNDAHSVIRLLLDKGANPDAARGDGCTPLHFAAAFGFSTAVTALIEGGADVRARSTLHTCLGIKDGAIELSIGSTPLHAAVKNFRVGICEALLKHTPGLGDIPDWVGQTPLHYAASQSLHEIVKMLLEHGANDGAVDCRGQTPLDLARHINDERGIGLLEEHADRAGVLASTLADPSESPITPHRAFLPHIPAVSSQLTLYASLEPLNEPSTKRHSLLNQLGITAYSVYLFWSHNSGPIHNSFVLRFIPVTYKNEPDLETPDGSSADSDEDPVRGGAGGGARKFRVKVKAQFGGYSTNGHFMPRITYQMSVSQQKRASRLMPNAGVGARQSKMLTGNGLGDLSLSALNLNTAAPSLVVQFVSPSNSAAISAPSQSHRQSTHLPIRLAVPLKGTSKDVISDSDLNTVIYKHLIGAVMESQQLEYTELREHNPITDWAMRIAKGIFRAGHGGYESASGRSSAVVLLGESR